MLSQLTSLMAMFGAWGIISIPPIINEMKLVTNSSNHYLIFVSFSFPQINDTSSLYFWKLWVQYTG